MSDKMLEKLHIIGWDNLEDFILAALVTGDSLLMVGTHGSAKTYCAQQVARALGVKFGKIDAAKAEFEDIIGFPNPKSLSQGKFEYIPTPISVADKEFLFIDEINRAKPHIQNKLLEICYSRQIMGMPTKIKWVWGAMNLGEEYTGLEPLDLAFAGRFAFVLPIPEAVDMKKEEIDEIILNENETDAIAFKKFWIPDRHNPGKRNRRHPDSRLLGLLGRAARIYESLSYELGELVRDYLCCFARVLNKEAKVKIDGRRLSMIRRNIIGYVAVRQAKNSPDYPGKNIVEAIYRVLPYSFPNLAIGKPLEKVKLEAAVRLAEKLVGKSNLFYQAIFCEDPAQQAKTLLKGNLSLFAQRKLTQKILNDEDKNVLMPLVLFPFALLANSPLSLDVRLLILKQLKSLIKEYILSENSLVEIKRIQNLKLFQKQPDKTIGTEEIKQTISAVVDKVVKGKNFRQKKTKTKEWLEFLLHCKKVLQPIYEEIKNAQS